MASGKEFNATDYIQHHLTFLNKQVGEGGVLDDQRRFAGDRGDPGRRWRSVSCGGWCAAPPPACPRKRQAFVELAVRLRRRAGEGHLPPRRPPRLRRARGADRVRLGAADERDGLPAGGRHGAGSGTRVPRARLPHRADGRRQHHVCARAVGLAADDLVSRSRPRAWAAGSTSCSARRSAPTRCCGPFNLLFNFIEYVSKPLSHSLRLFGNMYAGEIIFLLLWLLAADRGLVGTCSPSSSGWAGRSSTS